MSRSRALPIAVIALLASLFTGLAPSGAAVGDVTVLDDGHLVSGGFIPRVAGAVDGTTLVTVRVDNPAVDQVRVRTLAGGVVVRWDAGVPSGVVGEEITLHVEIPAQAVSHDVVVDEIINGVATEVARWDDVVAGDVLVIQGQSNAVAGYGSDVLPQSPFVRSFGTSEFGITPSAADRSWHLADGNANPTYGPGKIGKWAMQMALQIVDQHDVPVAVINGAHGGRPIGFFPPNPADPTDINTNYGRLLQRLEAAGITESVRSVLWYQGESDRVAPETHEPGFRALVDTWQQQFPDLEQVYLFQIHKGCSQSADQDEAHLLIRYAQQDIAHDRADVTDLSTSAAPGHDGCHYDLAGYQELGDRAFRVVSRDLYADQDLPGTATPSAYFARYTSAARTAVDVWFTDTDDIITAAAGVEDDLLIGGVTGQVVSVTGHAGRIRLQLAAAGPATATVAYRAWGPTWLTNSLGVGAVASEVAIAASGTTVPPITSEMAPLSSFGNPALGPCRVTLNASGSVTVAWTDIGANGYDIIRDGAQPRWVTSARYEDFVPATNYRIIAWGNGTNGSETTCTGVGGNGGFDCSVTVLANGSVAVSWPNIGANGYDLIQDNAPASWVTATQFVDASPAAQYTVIAWGNGTNGTTATCAGPGFSCTVVANGNGTVTVSWTDVGANGYDLIETGLPAIWVTATQYVDQTPAAQYSIIPWSGGSPGPTATC